MIGRDTRWPLAVVLIFIVMVSGAHAQQRVRGAGRTAVAGEKAVRFYNPVLDGRGFFMSRELRKNDAIVLSFFATWCVPCRKELPEFQELSRAFPGGKIAWRLVNSGDKPDSIRAFLRKLSVRVPVLLDRYLKTTRRYAGDPPRLPTTVIIGRDSIVRYLHHGYDGDDGLAGIAREIARILDRPVPKQWREPEPESTP
jgi:cytochrome c biogenesis protein CcmG, thiol:disulfide interchange protein DsbE